ncbi:hypothetical protein [Nonomuraea sp. SBT364]|uniref:hypothetical protein n=1 Tax=Nonomuraea sp. SBT364 TaxID=1580530 RepID=UPI0018CEA5AB|nr:hypothetical protein [Nonomuraea sp. SBT364]
MIGALYMGCLSFFDVRGMVPRPLTLEVEHPTLDGQTKITEIPRREGRRRPA